MYEKEAKQQEEKIEKMKAEDGENYAIKKQVKFMNTSCVTVSLICLQLNVYFGFGYKHYSKYRWPQDVSL